MKYPSLGDRTDLIKAHIYSKNDPISIFNWAGWQRLVRKLYVTWAWDAVSIHDYKHPIHRYIHKAGLIVGFMLINEAYGAGGSYDCGGEGTLSEIYRGWG